MSFYYLLQGESKLPNPLKGLCPKPERSGDNVCDDVNNVIECDFDSGDCCKKGANIDFCTWCECYESK